MAKVKEFIEEWIQSPPEEETRCGNWIGTPNRLAIDTPSLGYELFAFRLANGKVLFNSGRTDNATGERRAWGNRAWRPGSVDGEALSQEVARLAGGLPIPFQAFRQAGVPLPAREEDPIPETLKILEWTGAEHVELSHKHGQRTYCSIKKRTVEPGVCTWKRHYAGAALLKFRGKVSTPIRDFHGKILEMTDADKEKDIHFLFDVDRGELCKGRFNAFITQLADQCKALTIEQAYQAMCPAHVKAAMDKGLDVKRQGEWFFVPFPEFIEAFPTISEETLAKAKAFPHPYGYGIPAEYVKPRETYYRKDKGGWQITNGLPNNYTEASKRWSKDVEDWWEAVAVIRNRVAKPVNLRVQGSRDHSVTEGYWVRDLEQMGIPIDDPEKWPAVVKGTVSAPDHEDLGLDDWHLVSSNGGHGGVGNSFTFSGGID